MEGKTADTVSRDRRITQVSLNGQDIGGEPHVVLTVTSKEDVPNTELNALDETVSIKYFSRQTSFADISVGADKFIIENGRVPLPTSNHDTLRKTVARTRDISLGLFDAKDSEQLDIVKSFAESGSREPAAFEKALSSADTLIQKWKAERAPEGTDTDMTRRVYLLGLLQGAKVIITAMQDPASSEEDNDSAL